MPRHKNFSGGFYYLGTKIPLDMLKQLEALRRPGERRSDVVRRLIQEASCSTNSNAQAVGSLGANGVAAANGNKTSNKGKHHDTTDPSHVSR